MESRLDKMHLDEGKIGNASVQNLTDFDIQEMIIRELGERKSNDFTTVVLTFLYAAIFLSGLVGNVSTCWVIAKNAFMQSATNSYLFSLAVSDLLIIVLGENETGNITVFDIDTYVSVNLGDRRQDAGSLVLLTAIYGTIFLTGIAGNLCTCIVIYRNIYMHTVTNYYLASLALSDILALLFALPPEVYAIWEAYPWRFGEPFCIFKSFLLESTSYASVLTITGFTCERYIAICHPITGQKVSRQSRALKCILVIWIVSALSALPYPIHTRTFYYLKDPRTALPISDTLLCNIPLRWHPRMIVMFQVSTFAFFLLPMTIITVMYILIGIRLRRTEFNSNSGYFTSSTKSTATRARRAVLRMLVAVVVAFFVCWAPFHAQRLTALYVKHWTAEAMDIHSRLFYVSGVLYFLSSTVNPILYNLLSRKFRYAFKRTFCRCCLNLDAFPTFYKLKAIFTNKNDQPSTSPSGMRYIFPQKPLLLESCSKQKGSSSATKLAANQISTKDTILKLSTGCVSSSGSHAHSDGRLHCLCHHKSCLNNRTRLSIESQMFGKQFNNASYQDVETLKRLQCFQTECCYHRQGSLKNDPVTTSDVNVNFL